MSRSCEPVVSIVLPVRDERRHIKGCLESILAQDFGLERMEVLVVDGLSTDGTRELVAGYARRLPNLRLLDNPRGIVPSAMNAGVRAAVGRYVVRVDGHTILPPDYVSLCVRYLEETGADNVGGTMRAVGEGYLAQAIAIATSSPFGIGNSPFHYSDEEQWVDTVYLGALRREVFERAGLYDETLVRNQDYELNYRIRRSGGRIFYTPRICAYYHGRDNLPALARQYYQYGLWKARVIARHPASTRPRHLAAPLFVGGLLGLPLVALAAPPAWLLLALEGALYLLATAFFSAREAARRGWRFLPALPPIFLLMHLAWGLGFLRAAAGLLGRALVSPLARS